MERWEIVEATIYWNAQENQWEDYDTLQKYLDEGWQPYAVVAERGQFQGKSIANWGFYEPEALQFTSFVHYLRGQMTEQPG